MRFSFLVLLLIPLLAACQTKSGVVQAEQAATEDRAELPQLPGQMYKPPAEEGLIEPMQKTDEEWAAELNEIEFYVLRQQGTERSFTGDLWDNKASGVYTCRACGLPLFSSKTKYRSGTGWPSFYEPIHENYIAENVDNRHGMRRVEVHCARCGGHQGHVFPDGPQPTGLRYCINSVSMDFVPDGDEE